MGPHSRRAVNPHPRAAEHRLLALFFGAGLTSQEDRAQEVR
jgi:hypothetical protein